ncbi:MAG: type II toxin-antitoxin system RelE/ParE family toxin [Bacteroidota bacterium]
MVKYKVSWSVEAEIDLTGILEFYLQRNKSATYSKKLYAKIKKAVSSISKNPNLGIETDIDTVRALITGDYQIIYEIIADNIVISMLWDCRRNPDDKKIGKRIKRK